MKMMIDVDDVIAKRWAETRSPEGAPVIPSTNWPWLTLQSMERGRGDCASLNDDVHDCDGCLSVGEPKRWV